MVHTPGTSISAKVDCLVWHSTLMMIRYYGQSSFLNFDTNCSSKLANPKFMQQAQSICNERICLFRKNTSRTQEDEKASNLIFTVNHQISLYSYQLLIRKGDWITSLYEISYTNIAYIHEVILIPQRARSTLIAEYCDTSQHAKEEACSIIEHIFIVEPRRILIPIAPYQVHLFTNFQEIISLHTIHYIYVRRYMSQCYTCPCVNFGMFFM